MGGTQAEARSHPDARVPGSVAARHAARVVILFIARALPPWSRPNAAGYRESPRPGRLPAVAVGLLCLILWVTICSCAVRRDGGAVSEDAPVFYPGLPEQPRVQFLTTYTSEEDVTGKVGGFRKFVVGEKEYKKLGKPYGIALHDGKLLVCDTRANVVVIFDLVARSVGVLGEKKPGRLAKPINIAVDQSGTRYVADTSLRRVLVYNESNVYVRAFGDPARWSPSDITVSGNRLYVTDVQNGQVVVLDKSRGQELQRFGRKGSGEGEMFFPTNIEVDAEGDIYVSDTGNFRVLKFDSQGKLIRQFGSLGRALGKFARPKGIAVDRDGRLYVVDTAFENVQIFGPSGELLLVFGSAGNAPGGLNLPAKIEIDYDNVELFADRVAPGFEADYLILVSSQFGSNKVNVYAFLKPLQRESQS